MEEGDNGRSLIDIVGVGDTRADAWGVVELEASPIENAAAARRRSSSVDLYGRGF